MRRDAPAAAGFTLFETLVAMTVLALLAAVLLRGVVGVRADAAWFSDHTGRVLLATSVLDEAVGNRRLRDGVYRGQQNGRRWVLTALTADDVAASSATADAAPTTDDATGLVWHPQRLTVRVEAPNHPVVIETVRLAVAP